MRLFVYVLVVDVGFAPNPFFGYCTLATCKPRIRRSAAVGDWVAGIGSPQNGLEGKIVFAMRVGETMRFDEYWTDERFAQKRPNWQGDAMERRGDNVYHRNLSTGDWIQEASCHSNKDGTTNAADLRRDTNPPRVLIAHEFAYYGASAVDIPDRFRSWDGTDYFGSVRGYRCNIPDDLRDAFVAWLRGHCAETGGRAGLPLIWPDTSTACAATPSRRPATRRC